ncbi:hypothetical protein M5D96_012599, partial [Drosophila gunungcola]
PWTSQEQPWAQGLRSRDPIRVVAHLICCGFTPQAKRQLATRATAPAKATKRRAICTSICGNKTPARRRPKKKTKNNRKRKAREGKGDKANNQKDF